MPMKIIAVSKAKYVDAYKLEIIFTDKKKR
jgi:hypothetical protein